MILHLVRHADELMASQDPERGLSPLGRSQARSLGMKLAEAGANPAAIFSSTKARAIQTMMLVGAELSQNGWKGRTSERRGLSPNDDPTPIVDLINGFNDNLMIVSHLPFLPELAGRFCDEIIVFGTAEAHAFEITDGKWNRTRSFLGE